MTTDIAHEAIWKSFTAPNRMILFVSPGLRQSRIPMRVIHDVVMSKTDLARQVIKKNESTLELSNGSIFISLPNSPGLIRGFPATDVYLDEAAHFENSSQVMAAIRPSLLATHGSLTVQSTPFGKRGLFFNLYQQAVDLKDTPAADTYKHYDFFPSTINPNITKDDVDRMIQDGDMTELEVQQEIYGVFIEEVDAYFPMDLIQPQALIDVEALLKAGVEGARYFWGVDLGKKRSETVIYVVEWVKKLVRMAEDGEPVEKNVLRIVYVKTFSKTDYTDQVGEMSKLKNIFPPVVCLVDQTGVGESVIEQIKMNVPHVQGEIFTDDRKIDLASRLRLLFEGKEIEIVNDRKLLMQLNGLTYHVGKTGKILFEPADSAKIKQDHAWALTLAAKAATLVTAPTLLKVE